MTEFKPGDRVCSTVGGFYMGLTGTIRDKAQVRYGIFTHWIIELDNGKRLVLSSRYLRLVKEK